MDILFTLSAILGSLLALITLPGTLELLLLTLSGALPARQLKPAAQPQALQHLAVVIPAHNEASGIADCVHSLRACTPPSCQLSLVVVADNCEDDTAQCAEQAGARVLVRHNLELRGKGYALDDAFQQLLAEGVDAVLIVDADTAAAPNFLTAAEHYFTQGAAAVQCRYTVKNPDESLRTRLMHVALLAFNVLRPRGREYWRLSVGIGGNGFGLRAETLQQVPYTAHSVVEDLEYHLALVKAGYRVVFIDSTTVQADMPTAGKGVDSQRERWEGGRFRMIREHVPTLLRAIMRGQWRLGEPLLELLLLPLAFHVMLLTIILLLPFAVTQLYAFLALLLVGLHVLLGIWVGGGSWKDLHALLSAPFYIGWKLAMLPRLLKAASKHTAWVRTNREK